MEAYKWVEITGKDWDRLNEGTREIFIDQSGRLSFAGRADVLKDYQINPIRKILTQRNWMGNCWNYC